MQSLCTNVGNIPLSGDRIHLNDSTLHMTLNPEAPRREVSDFADTLASQDLLSSRTVDVQFQDQAFHTQGKT